MNFNIKKVGIINDSNVTIDGLTIITGINNSGKSTIGKALYATLEAFNNMDFKKEEQMVNIYARIYLDVQNTLSLYEIARFIDIDRVDDRYSELVMDLVENYGFMRRSKYSNKSINEQFNLILDFLNFVTVDYIKYICTNSKAETSNKFKKYCNNFNTVLDRAKKIASDGKEIFNDSENIKISKIFVHDLLKKEFKNQVFPINDISEERNSKFTLYDNGEKVFDFLYNDEKGVVSSGKICKKPTLKNIFLIDDAYVIDKIGDFVNPSPLYMYRRNVYDYSHNTLLLKNLTVDNNMSALEDFLNDKNYNETMREIDAILPGDLEEKDGNYYYKSKNDNKYLRVENLATGAKLFAILKGLIKKGKINYNTMLILDEPESHLHPEWQNIMAQVIVMLVDKLNVNILLTTHSVNFVLALETYMHKHKIEEKTNFYRTIYDYNSNLVDYKNSNDELNKIYENLSSPYDKMILKKNSLFEN